jgi:hypothetical protein
MSENKESRFAWQKLNDKRIAFFSRFEGVFLWLLGIPTLIISIIAIRYIILWISNGVDIFGSFLTPGR